MSEITLQNQLNELNGQVTSLVAENKKLEKKVDRILHILENGELSTSFERELIVSVKAISKQIDERLGGY